MAARTGEVSADDIVVLDALESVRRRHDLYFGTTDSAGLLNLLVAVLGKAIDRHLNDGARSISITCAPDGWISVEDDGSGLPLDTIVAAFTNYGGFRRPRGRDARNALDDGRWSHTCAVCSRFEVVTHRAGHAWSIAFSEGRVIEPLEKGPPRRQPGTTIRFLPDPKIYKRALTDLDAAYARLLDIARLLPKLTLSFQGQRLDGSGGLLEMCGTRSDATSLSAYGNARGVEVDVAMAWSHTLDAPIVRSFVNYREVFDGGSQVEGVWLGLAAAAPTPALKRESRAGLVVALHVRMNEPNTRRGALESDDARDAVTAVVEKTLRAAPWWWDRVAELTRRG